MIKTRMTDSLKFKPVVVGEDLLKGDTFYMLVDDGLLRKLKNCLYYTSDAITAQRLYGGLLLECKLVQQEVK